MNILFWNMNKKQNIKVTQELLVENEIDVAILAEYSDTGIDKIIDQQGDSYIRHEGYGGCTKITLLAKNNYSIKVVREDARFTIYVCSDGESLFIIAGVHIPDRLHNGLLTRAECIRRLKEMIEQVEKQENKDRTIIIGDFNANPTDMEIAGKSGLNAILYSSLIQAKEEINHGATKKKRLYNPILNYWKDEDGKRGSIYYDSDESLYWNCFDQVLLRRSLLTSFLSMDYCTRTKETNLMSKVKPNSKYSDHLPLVARFR